MNYQGKELQSRLAADYVSGGMRGAARRRFEALVAADAGLRREVREWENEIYPLAWSLSPLTPPGRVWRAIRARLRGVNPVKSWGWNGLYSWRLLSGALAIALIAGVALYPLQVDRAARAQLLAVLQTPQAQAMLVVRADSSGVLHVRTLQDLRAVAGDKALELWALPPGGKPQSLGLVAPGGTTALTRPDGLQGVPQLAVTLEPPGGSPTGQPTGSIIMSGEVLPI
jgi:anti-sigma-K factor RskA